MRRLLLVFMIIMVFAFSVFSAAAHAADTQPLNDDSGQVIGAAQEAEMTTLGNTAADGSIANSDGINTNAATAWISIICVLTASAIVAVVIMLAKKNKGSK